MTVYNTSLKPLILVSLKISQLVSRRNKILRHICEPEGKFNLIAYSLTGKKRQERDVLSFKINLKMDGKRVINLAYR